MTQMVSSITGAGVDELRTSLIAHKPDEWVRKAKEASVGVDSSGGAVASSEQRGGVRVARSASERQETALAQREVDRSWRASASKGTDVPTQLRGKAAQRAHIRANRRARRSDRKNLRVPFGRYEGAALEVPGAPSQSPASLMYAAKHTHDGTVAPPTRQSRQLAARAAEAQSHAKAVGFETWVRRKSKRQPSKPFQRHSR